MNWVKDRFKSITSGDDAESTPADADDKAPNRETPVALATESSNELTEYGLAYQAEYGLDPYDCLSLNNRVILSFLYESLFVVNSRYAAEPVLATGYDVSGDGLSTTVYLRRGVLFHDGREMTARMSSIPSRRRAVRIITARVFTPSRMSPRRTIIRSS